MDNGKIDWVAVMVTIPLVLFFAALLLNGFGGAPHG